MQEMAVNLFLKFVIAAFIFYAGWKVTGVLRGLIVSALTRRKLDPMLVSFAGNLAYITCSCA